MAKNVVIVESPAKAKTIEKFLGKDYKVVSSYGHIADLPSNELGVDINNGFQPKYLISNDKKQVVKELKALTQKAEMVWLASDEDREGEAISWHLAETLKLKPQNTIGNFINIEITGQINNNFTEHVLQSPLYMHEYGHYIDNRLSYLFAVGLPSFISAGISTSEEHSRRGYEIRANRKAARYFGRYYGVDWTNFEPPHDRYHR